jgi:AraC-like DNA-binding protein
VVAAASEPDQGWAVWARVSPAPGQVLDLLHARMAEPFAPHVHDGFSIGACIEGLEMIRYRDRRHYAAPGSVVILPPGEAHTGGPSDGANFVYRVMYPTVELLGDGAARPPCFPEPVVMDPALAAEMRRVHAAMSRAARGNGPPGTEPVGAERVGTKLVGAERVGTKLVGAEQVGTEPVGTEPVGTEPVGTEPVGTEPLEAESRLCWLFGELVRRHAAPAAPADVLPGAGALARRVMGRLADQLTCPPALAELAAEAGLSRYQLLRSFRAEVGMPPYAWLAQHRVARARVLLEQGHRPADAATLTGFADQAHLTRWFRRVVGVTPGAYRNGVQDSRRPHR